MAPVRTCGGCTTWRSLFGARPDTYGLLYIYLWILFFHKLKSKTVAISGRSRIDHCCRVLLVSCVIFISVSMATKNKKCLECFRSIIICPNSRKETRGYSFRVEIELFTKKNSNISQLNQAFQLSLFWKVEETTMQVDLWIISV